MERLQDFCKGYELKDMWNMDESGCSLKNFATKGLAIPGKKSEGGKRSKQRITVAFLLVLTEKKWESQL